MFILKQTLKNKQFSQLRLLRNLYRIHNTWLECRIECYSMYNVSVCWSVLLWPMSCPYVDSWSSLTCTAGGTLTSQLKVRTHWWSACSLSLSLYLKQTHTHIKICSLYYNCKINTKHCLCTFLTIKPTAYTQHCIVCVLRAAQFH